MRELVKGSHVKHFINIFSHSLEGLLAVIRSMTAGSFNFLKAA
jgi:hypothetical protein